MRGVRHSQQRHLVHHQQAVHTAQALILDVVAIERLRQQCGAALLERGWHQCGIEEQPGLALAGALVAGFVAGGGLVSPLGLRIASTTLRATLGNVAAIAALDLLRREVTDGGARGNSGDARRAK